MNRDDMLKQLGVSMQQLEDLFQKFQAFFNSLDAQQQQVVKTSMPNVQQALAAFGPEVNEADLLDLFRADAQRPPLACFLPLQQGKAR
ncbi:MAG: hypothetical protein WBW69_04660 [Candidatus Korobacteraceae bacterium]